MTVVTKIIKIIKKLIKKLIVVVFGNSKYSKFVIITRSRSGSNLLVNLLNSHPHIVSYEELFNRLKGKSCIQIWNNIFNKHLPWIKTVGFKIFYYHPLDSDDNHVWELLKSDTTIKVIHLRRENMLRTYISRELAGKTNKWSSTNSSEISPYDKRLHIDIDECLASFEKTKLWEMHVNTMFANHAIKEITYENLVNNNVAVMQELLKFLSVPNKRLSSVLKKQNPEHLKTLISNYHEVEKAIKSNNYECFLV